MFPQRKEILLTSATNGVEYMTNIVLSHHGLHIELGDASVSYNVPLYLSDGTELDRRLYCACTYNLNGEHHFAWYLGGYSCTVLAFSPSDVFAMAMQPDDTDMTYMCRTGIVPPKEVLSNLGITHWQYCQILEMNVLHERIGRNIWDKYKNV